MVLEVAALAHLVVHEHGVGVVRVHDELYTCVSSSVSHGIVFLVSRFLPVLSVKMACDDLVEEPQMSGPNINRVGGRGENVFWSTEEGMSLMYPPPQSSFCSCFAENWSTRVLPSLEKVAPMSAEMA